MGLPWHNRVNRIDYFLSCVVAWGTALIDLNTYSNFVVIAQKEAGLFQEALFQLFQENHSLFHSYTLFFYS